MGQNDVVIKVYFVDGSYKSLYVGENDTTSKVVQTILEKVTFPKTKGLQLFTYIKENSEINQHEIQENANPGQIYKKLDQEKGNNFKMVLKRKKDNFKGWSEEKDGASNVNTTTGAKEVAKPPSRPPPNPNAGRQDRTASFSVSESNPPPPMGDTPPNRSNTLRPGANPLMSELTLKRNQAQNQNILKTVPKKEQSQTIIIDWINKKLEEFNKDTIENLEGDLKSGCVMALLLEGLSGLNVGKEFNRAPNTKIQMIENNNIILRFLKVLGVNLQNFNGEDLWETRPETMVRFLGIIIKHFHDTNPEKTKARLSMLVSTQQLQQLQPTRKPAPPVRKPPPNNSNITDGVPLPPPIANHSDSNNVNTTTSPQIPPVQLRKVPPNASQSKSPGYVAKPPPKLAAKVPPTAVQSQSQPVQVPRKQPPSLPSRNQPSTSPPNNIETSSIPPPIATKKQPPSLPSRNPPPPLQQESLPSQPINKPTPPQRTVQKPSNTTTEQPPQPLKKPLPKPQAISQPPPPLSVPSEPEKKTAKPPVPTRSYIKPNPQTTQDTFNLPPPITDSEAFNPVLGSPSTMPLPPPPSSPPVLSISSEDVNYISTLPPPITNISVQEEEVKPVDVSPPVLKKKPPPPPRAKVQEEPVVQHVEEVPQPEVIQEQVEEQHYEEQYNYDDTQQQQYEEEQQYNYEEQTDQSQYDESQQYNYEDSNNQIQEVQEQPHQEDVVVKLDNDEEITFEELELILNNNNLNFDDLLKEHNESKGISSNPNNNNDYYGSNTSTSTPSIDINNLETSFDMKSSSQNTVEDDLADLLDKLARGEF